jgi:hypothetical protein
VGVEETGGNKIREAAFSTLVTNHKGANVAPRGVRDFCEGKTLKGEPSNGRGMKQGHETRAC